MNAFLNLVKICQFVLNILSRNEILTLIKGHNSGTNMRKRTCNNPKLDFVNVSAYIKFGEKLSICSQDIEGEQKFGVNQGHYSCTNTQKRRCNNPKLDPVNINAYKNFGENMSI